MKGLLGWMKGLLGWIEGLLGWIEGVVRMDRRGFLEVWNWNFGLDDWRLFGS